jgi:NitT/TauT family transport system permease protein
MNPFLFIILAVLATGGRVVGLIIISILMGWLLSYAAIKSKIFENIYISLIEVFESVPVISFFPIVLIIFVDSVGGPLGVELAADFLVFTAVVWNIWMGQYQAFKTIPNEMVEVGDNYNFGIGEKLRSIYIPYSIPRIVANLFPSISDGFFYITVSEVFTVGVTSYSTFGIGEPIDQFAASGNTFLLVLTFITLGIFVALLIIILRIIGNKAVAKYTLDTDTPIMKRGKPRIRQTARFSAVISQNTLGKLASYTRERRGSKDLEEMYSMEKKRGKIGMIAGIITLAIFVLILYYIVKFILSVSTAEWSYLFSQTPALLVGLLYDYVRVIVITLASIAFAFSLGYVLATRKKAESVGVPVIQTFSSYPVPAYFPFIFLGLYPFVADILGPLTEEGIVLLLGFMSTFYYVFYSFWMGIKAMPTEYNEIMKNLDMGFFKKMRYVIIPSTFPYLISGISSTINSAWGGLEIGEYWPDIAGGKTLQVHIGLMKTIDIATKNGNIALAAWGSFLFAIIVSVYSILFTRKMMDLARKKYIAEEGIYSA